MFHTLRAFGFAYYEVFNTVPATAGGLPVGWISRVEYHEPYVYVCFFCNGKEKPLTTTRATFGEARAWILEQAQAVAALFGQRVPTLEAQGGRA